MAYNMTAFGESNNIFLMFAAVNTASGNLLVYFLIIAVFTIMLVALMRRNPPAESFTAASLTTTLLCLAFLMADLINMVWVVGSTLILALSAVGLYLANKAS